jgi:hypothetical protein
MRPSLASLLVLSLRCGDLVGRVSVEGAFISSRLAHARSSEAPLLSQPSTSWGASSAAAPLPPPPPPLDVLYRTSVVPRSDFSLIQHHASSLLLLGGSRGHPRLCDETSSIAVGRQGMSLDTVGTAATAKTPSAEAGASSQLVQLLDIHVSNMLRKQTGREYRLCDGVPAELRVYQKSGAGMAWHQDDVLYDPPQVEVVFTIENTSNCATRWKGGPNDDEESSVETDPNSALVLAAGGAWHSVTSLKRGRRVIVKLAYALPGAERVEISSSRRETTARRRRKRIAESRTT